jgi:sigma-E factor negative regulatory protein RseC
MIQEYGYVVKTDEQFAWVHTQRKSTCGQCAAQKGCGTNVFSKVLGNKHTELKAINAANAKVGDTVVLGLRESVLLKSAFIMYMLPLLMMFIFAVFTQFIFNAVGNEASQFWIGIFAVTGLLLGFVYARYFAKQHQTDSEYHPVVLRQSTLVEQFSINHTQEV